MDLDELSAVIARFSVIAASLSDLICEIDINPLLCNTSGCIGVDALVVSRHVS